MDRESTTVKLSGALVGSQKLRRVRSEYQTKRQISEGTLADLIYPRMLLLGANVRHGRFELDYDVIKADLFPSNPEITVALIQRIVEILAAEGLLILYRDSQGRELAALTRYRGWSPGRDGASRYEPPPGTVDNGAEWNILHDPKAEAVVRALVAAPPVPAKRSRGRKAEVAPDGETIRNVIDFYGSVWTPRWRDPYTPANRRDVARTLGKGYTVDDCKVSIFLAKHGPHAWYRDHNHRLEYLTRPGVIEAVESRCERFTLANPQSFQAAQRHDMIKLLADRGYPTSVQEGPEDPNYERVRRQLQEREREAARRGAEAQAAAIVRGEQPGLE